MRSLLKNAMLFGVLATLFSACSTQVITTTNNNLPDTVIQSDTVEDGNVSTKISLFKLNNYTDTPRAGMRAANIFSGLLNAKGYSVISHIDAKSYSFDEAKKIARKDGSHFFLYGGVSEWRYKTGIDGEPAVSVQVSLYKTNDGSLVWSATGSDSDWGNGSIGTTAQDLFEAILSTK